MSLDSIEYLSLLALLLPLFWVVPQRARWVVLLAFSLYFHLSFGAPLSLIPFAVLFAANFLLGRWMGQTSSARVLAALFWGGVLVDLGVLVASRLSQTASGVQPIVRPQS